MVYRLWFFYSNNDYEQKVPGPRSCSVHELGCLNLFWIYSRILKKQALTSIKEWTCQQLVIKLTQKKSFFLPRPYVAFQQKVGPRFEVGFPNSKGMDYSYIFPGLNSGLQVDIPTSN